MDAGWAVNTSLLDRLCASCGVITAYRNVHGEEQVVPIKTRLALLAAMGWEVGSDADLERALEAREARGWRRLLPPVQVVRAGETCFEIGVVQSGERGVEWVGSP